jgi:exodeoxyribonuclease III
MKMVSWNCQGAFAGKSASIFSECPDIAVIQECSKVAAQSDAYDGYNAQWFGDDKNKGLGVFHRKEWTLHLLAQPNQKWVVPFAVQGPENFTLVAVWACAVKGERLASYVGQIHNALEQHSDWFESRQVVMAGDFNSNAIWDKNRSANHSSMVNRLARHGLTSAYHHCRKEEHGREQQPTFFLNRKVDKPYHLDYVFVPVSWQSRLKVEVGSHNDWSTLSDHCPLTLDLELQTDPQLPQKSSYT